MNPTSPTREVRLRRGGVLVAGAAIYAALVYGPLEFLWTPLLIGLAYLGAAAAGGRHGGMWATGLVLTGWGLGVVLTNKVDLGLSTADGYLIGIGAAAVAAGLLASRGFAVDLVAVGATTVFAGLIHTLAGDPVQALVEPWPYVALLGLVGAVNLVLAFLPQRAVERSAEPAGHPAGAMAAGR